MIAILPSRQHSKTFIQSNFRDLRFSILFCFFLFNSGCRAVSGPTPPPQPPRGPGGADYKHASVTSQKFGEGDSEFWIFSPEEPRPEEAPLVVFLHGWGGMNPRSYGAWIEHIVRKGQIVVYPRYQAGLLTSAEAMTGNAAGALSQAWTELTNNGPVRPRQDRIALVGHSLGGLIAANLAANPATGIPPAKALMLVEPGGETQMTIADLSTVPNDALVLLVVGEDDTNVGDRAARIVRDALTQIPRENMDLVTVRSERRSAPRLIADHFAPLATLPTFPPTAPELGEEDEVGDPQDAPLKARWEKRREKRQEARAARRAGNRRAPNAIDFFGYWKLLDGLLDASFRNSNRDYALGNTENQRFMGRLSDGSEVVQLQVQD